MLSRRDLVLRASAGAVALLEIRAFAASDFWNKKEASQWSPQEIDTLKTKSPWAKKVRGEGGFGGPRAAGSDAESMNRGGSRGSFGGMSDAESNGLGGGGGGNGGRGGGGGGRGGGGGDMGGMGAAQQGPEVVIRWESAAPMLDATKFQLPPALADHYAISITGLPPQLLQMVISGRGGPGRSRGGEEAQAGDGQKQTPTDPAAEARARQDRLLHSATLSARNHDPETADVVLQTSDKQTLIFGFQKSTLPLTASEKDVEFLMRMGPTTFKAKFEPKEMMYKGALTV